jgi:hypothetical protein
MIKEKMDEAIELLTVIDSRQEYYCPICKGRKIDGHYSECQLAKTLALLKSAKAEQLSVGEFKYCKEHRTIHCSCQQKIIDAQQQEIERLERWNQSLRDNEEARVKEIRVIVRQLKEEAAGNAKLKQDIEHLHGQGGLLFERIEKLTKYAAGIEDKEPYKDMVMEISAAMGNQANGSGISDKDLLAQIYKTLEEEKP